MKILIVDDNFVNRTVLQEILKHYGSVHVAVNGHEAIEAVEQALSMGEPYKFACLDIMMPQMDGQAALKKIRKIEEKAGYSFESRMKIIMTTALDDSANVMEAFREQCDGYLVKPVDKAKLLKLLEEAGILSRE